MNSTVITPLFVAVFTSAIILLGALLIEKDPSLFSLYKRNIKNTQRLRIWIFYVKKISIFSSIILLIGCTISILVKNTLWYFLFLVIPPIGSSFYITYLYFKITKEKIGKDVKIALSITILVVACIMAFISFIQMSDLDIRTNTKGILINGLYKTELKYTDIEELNLSEKYPNIKLRTNGFSLMDTQLGYFRTTRGKNITLQIHSSSPCIHIKTINGEEIFLNSKDRQKTKEIYDTISSYISTH